MKYPLFMLLFFCLFFINAQNNTPKVRLKSDGIVNEFYNYNAEGLLAKRTSSMYQGYSSFVYRNDSVIEYMVDLPDSAIFQVFKLNKEGLVESIALPYNGDYFYKYFKYKDKFQVSKSHHYPTDAQSNRYDIKDGNIITEYYDDTFSAKKYMAQKSVINYTYSDKKNTLGNEAFGMSYEGKSNVNLKSKEVDVTLTTGECGQPCPLQDSTKTTREFKYEYEFDTEGKIKKETKIFSTGNSIITKYYYW